MPRLQMLSAAEQTAAHLRAGVERGDWSGMMPGVNQLAPELGKYGGAILTVEKLVVQYMSQHNSS